MLRLYLWFQSIFHQSMDFWQEHPKLCMVMTRKQMVTILTLHGYYMMHMEQKEFSKVLSYKGHGKNPPMHFPKLQMFFHSRREKRNIQVKSQWYYHISKINSVIAKHQPFYLTIYLIFLGTEVMQQLFNIASSELAPDDISVTTTRFLMLYFSYRLTNIILTIFIH